MQIPSALTTTDPSSRRFLAAPIDLPAAWPLPAAHEWSAERRDQRQREQSLEAAEANALTPNSTRVIQDSEQRVEPGSRTFNRLKTRDLAAHQAESSAESFRSELRRAGQQPDAPTHGTTPPKLDPQSTAIPEPATAKTPAAPTTEKPAGGSLRPEPPVVNKTPPTSTPQTAQRQPTSQTTPAPLPPPRIILQPAPPSTPTPGPAAATASAAAAKPASQPATASTARAATTRETLPARATPPRPRPAEPAPRAAEVERVVRVIRQSLDGKKQATTLHLNPQELGKLRIHINLDQNALSLRIETQTTAAHRLLSEEAEALRQALRAAGIELAKLDLRPPTDAQTAGPAAWMPQPLQRPGSAARQAAKERGDERPGERQDDPGGANGDGLARYGAKERRSMDALTERWA